MRANPHARRSAAAAAEEDLTLAKTKREKKKNIAEGKAFIQATFNNTIVTITDLMGNTISWASAGALGFKGAKKSTPFAAQTTAESAATKALEQGLHELVVFVKGPGVGSEAAIRAFGVLGIRVRSIKDITPIPHNGCRPPKKRRV